MHALFGDALRLVRECANPDPRVALTVAELDVCVVELVVMHALHSTGHRSWSTGTAGQNAASIRLQGSAGSLWPLHTTVEVVDDVEVLLVELVAEVAVSVVREADVLDVVTVLLLSDFVDVLEDEVLEVPEAVELVAVTIVAVEDTHDPQSTGHEARK